MSILKSVVNWIKKLRDAVTDILAPEDAKIQKLLDLPAGTMRDLLPKSPVYSRDIFVLFDYQNKIIKLIVKSIKYKNNNGLRKRIAVYLYEEILEISSEIALFEGAPPLLVPMPMSEKEKRSRGWSQCEELVREIKNLSDGNIEVSYNTLKKVRETRRQTNLGKEQRIENVKGSMRAFLRSPSNSSGSNDEATIKTPRPDRSVGRPRTVIVLDDVYTTGATLDEARRALLSAGARRAIGLFIAH